jgi:cytochrome c-type biogenesis protein CcmH
MRRALAALAAALALFVSASAALSFENDVPFDDPAQEERARELSRHFRCLVCQNQSIFDSDADLARDLRIIVRERIAAGDSDEQITAFLVERYGDFVLLNPPVKAKTYLLWFGPALFALLAIGIVVIFYRRGARMQVAGPAALSPAERERLEKLLDDEQA